MDNDDILVGRILTRREILTLFGATSAALLASACFGSDSSPAKTAPAAGGAVGGASAATGSPSVAAPVVTAGAATSAGTAAATAAPSCVVTPQLTEGPYFVDEKLNRSDIRTNPSDGKVTDGVPLLLTFNVLGVAATACAPLANATVDVWHCDALGVYSDASDRSFNTRGQQFLRGFQQTDARGKATFITVYPGWYQGRAVHIHFKVRGTRPDGRTYEFNSQLFFDESLTDLVHAQAPYRARGKRTLLNSGDGIYRETNGQTLLQVAKSGAGYTGAFSIGLQQA